jgi:hypothetical protein
MTNPPCSNFLLKFGFRFEVVKQLVQLFVESRRIFVAIFPSNEPNTTFSLIVYFSVLGIRGSLSFENRLDGILSSFKSNKIQSCNFILSSTRSQDRVTAGDLKAKSNKVF